MVDWFADHHYPSHTRRPSSIMSTAASANSAATSTRHILNMNSQLEPPTLPFASNVSLRSGTDSPLLRPQSIHSLSINYLPSKFSDAVLYNGLKNRGKGLHLGPKRGGGREAFRSGEARMPGEGDEDYDGVQGNLFGKEGGRTQPRLRWNKFKWTLFFSNILVSILYLLSTTTSLGPAAQFDGSNHHRMLLDTHHVFSALADFFFPLPSPSPLVLRIFPRRHHLSALHLV